MPTIRTGARMNSHYRLSNGASVAGFVPDVGKAIDKVITRRKEMKRA
jgi:hypothetical protein